MHYCHINSTSQRHIDRVLQLIDQTRHEGSHVTTEAYPYGSGSTGIGAAFLDPDRLARWNLTPSSIVYLKTGERVADAARLRQLRSEDPGGVCIVEILREDDPADRAILDRGVLSPDTMLATDAMPILMDGTPVDPLQWPPPSGAVTHPRAAGTFAKTLRTYVRTGRMSLMDFARRSSLLPAQVLERMSPDMRRKGRLQAGADADLVVFDLESVSDQATYLDSVRPSTGFALVMVNGTAVVRDGALDVSVMPGRPIRAK